MIISNIVPFTIPASENKLKIELPYSYKDRFYKIIGTHDYAQSTLNLIYNVQVDAVNEKTKNSFYLTTTKTIADIASVGFIAFGISE